MPRHAFTASVARALPRPLAATSRRFLGLLERRLRALEAVERTAAWPRPPSRAAADRRLARRFLARRVGTWHDGDENLVRDGLTPVPRPGGDRTRALAHSLLAMADTLAAIDPPPPTLWCFLWEMEAVLATIAESRDRASGVL